MQQDKCPEPADIKGNKIERSVNGPVIQLETNLLTTGILAKTNLQPIKIHPSGAHPADVVETGQIVEAIG